MLPTGAKCLEEAKGCTGQSTDRMLHRGPDRQSAACVIWASYPWTHLRCEGSEGSEGGGGALRAQIIKNAASLVFSTKAKRSGEISPSDGTGCITVGDLSTQSIIKAFSICPIAARSPARDDERAVAPCRLLEEDRKILFPYGGPPPPRWEGCHWVLSGP